MKAIETRYKGYRFRSRLEARWAVFFDALGVSWEYEQEGFDLDEYGRYLPDFTITNHYGEPQHWIEIKGHKNLGSREYGVAYALSDHMGGYILFGTPEPPSYRGPKSGAEPPILSHPDGFIPFTPNGSPEPGWGWYQGSWAMDFGKVLDKSRRDLGVDGYIVPILRLECWHERVDDGAIYLCPVPAWEPMLLPQYGTGDPLKAGTKRIDSPRLLAAYAAARAARFEYGEQP